METSSSRLPLLFSRYYSGLATAVETNELMQLIKVSEDDEALSALIKKAWENVHPDAREFSAEESEQMLQSILQELNSEEREEIPEPKVRSLWWLRAAAASVLIVGGLALYWLEGRPRKKAELAVAPTQVTDIPPGGNRAVLAFSDGRKVVLDDVANGTLGKHGAAQFTKTRDGQLSIVVSKTIKPADLQTNTLSTPKGGEYQITLADGSKVWLNASSSIRFPTVFADKNRIVEITGEAYFEVTKDKRRPFKVRFGASEVEVLGTSFNIMAYQDEKESKTTLVEGSVKLLNGSESKKLRPGEQGAILSSGTIQTAIVDIEREIAWKQGLFYFRDSGIEEIMRQAARWYNVEVSYQGKIPRRQFTGKVARNVNISELLKMLRYAGVNCQIENKNIVVKM
jgi:ferric-dicitrate binding protein FerR (iron transport regulator)